MSRVSARVSMWISGDLRECLSSSAQDDRIFRARDGDRWFYAEPGNWNKGNRQLVNKTRLATEVRTC